ncbi:MAG: ABC transporter substrate-binding protein [Caldilineaceae bacterium]
MVVAACQQAPATPQVLTVTVVVTSTPEPAVATPAAPVSAPASATTTCPHGSLAEQSEVVLGAIFPISKPAMMLSGFAMQAAANLAIADINEQGGIAGKPVRLVAYDSGSSAIQGAVFAERLATLDCVAAIAGVFHSDVALAIKTVAMKHHLPVVFADPYADEVTADFASEIFRIAPTRTMLAKMMGDWLSEVGDYNSDGKQLAVLLVDNNSYGTTRIKQAKDCLSTTDIRLEAYTVDLPTTDFSPIIARIVALDTLPDAIFIQLHNGNALELQKQLLAAGIGPARSTLLVTTATALDYNAFWAQVPNGEYTVIAQIGPQPSTVTEMGQRFANKYQQYFQHWPESIAFETYDSLLLVADALRRANSLNADALIQALETTDLQLASGHYTFPYGSRNPPDGETVPNYMWHQWPDPQILYMQYTAPNQLPGDAAIIWPAAYRTTDGPLARRLIARR